MDDNSEICKGISKLKKKLFGKNMKENWQLNKLDLFRLSIYELCISIFLYFCIKLHV